MSAPWLNSASPPLLYICTRGGTEGTHCKPPPTQPPLESWPTLQWGGRDTHIPCCVQEPIHTTNTSSWHTMRRQGYTYHAVYRSQSTPPTLPLDLYHEEAGIHIPCCVQEPIHTDTNTNSSWPFFAQWPTVADRIRSRNFSHQSWTRVKNG